MVFVAGCTGTKFVPEGKYLYTGAEIKFEANGSLPDKSRLEAELEESIRLKPNGKILGSRPGVWFYFVAGEPKKRKSPRGFVKYKLGKEPVYLKEDVPERTALAMRSVLRNNGYLEGEVDHKVQRDAKTASVVYTARVPTPPYRLRNITYEALDTVYGNLASGLRRRSLLRTGRQYRLSRLEEELGRIGQAVRDSGYYYFDPKFLVFQADTTAGERQVDLRLVFEGKIPPQIRTTYRLDTVEIINNYAPTRDSSLRQYDTTRVGDYTYYHRRDDFRPSIILDAVNLRKDSLYRRTDHELTLSRLSNLGAFKFVTVRFTPETDNRLKARIFLTPQLKKSLRVEAQMTSKSNNFVGPAITGTFINRNFLRGAELFQWQLHTSYEIQANARQAGPVFAFEAGTEASLTLPRLVTPVRVRYGSLRFMPQTTMKLGVLLQNRVGFFQINSFNASYGYLWRETQQKNHAFYPVDLIYLQRRRLSPEFLARLAVDPFLNRSTENQAILGSRYSYTYNSQTGEQPRNRQRNNLYFNGNIDLSGNLAFLFQRLAGSEGGTFDRPFEVFGQPYSQYARADVDLRFYRQLTKRQQLATRLIVGAGYAYGNAFTMPYVKQFAAGGSNSVRAFRARSLGPGSYDAFNDVDVRAFIDQTGDLKLESSVEYRFDIVGFLKGAAFVDAGNVWLLRGDTTRPGGDFEWNRFYKEIAVGTGFGLRVDASFFVLRLDLAFPLRRPYLPENERWVFDQIAPLNRDWRRNNLILNIGIGYPF